MEKQRGEDVPGGKSKKKNCGATEMGGKIDLAPSKKKKDMIRKPRTPWGHD